MRHMLIGTMCISIGILFASGCLGEKVGNIKATCPQCDRTYTIEICGNCKAEGEFKLLLDGKMFRCTKCEETYATYQCRNDGTIIKRFRIE